jgi:hypothetical protein
MVCTLSLSVLGVGCTDKQLLEIRPPDGFRYTTTPNGTPIELAYWNTDMTTSERNLANSQCNSVISQDGLTVTKMYEPEFYNCHSYAWFNNSHVANRRWLDYYAQPTSQGNPTRPENLSNYWTDGSYTFVGTTTNGTIHPNAPNNAKVFYSTTNPLYTHSALISYTPGMFLSKWGYGGLYHHAPNQVPLEYRNNNTNPTLKFYRS